MLTIKLIKAIETGPRQMTLGFESVSSEEKEALVLSFFLERMQATGEVFLEDLVTFAQACHALTEDDILQTVFWAAEDYKLHFRVHDRAVSPREARKALLNDPAVPVALADNRQAEESLFQATIGFFYALSPDFSGFADNDQYQFAQALRALFRQWESSLDTLLAQSAQPFFPGRALVLGHQHFLKHLLARQDTSSLIRNSHDQQAAISQLYADLTLLTGFYARHSGFWSFLIQLSASLDDYKEDSARFPEALADIQTLNRILNSKTPWDLIPEAEQISCRLEALSAQIVQEKLRVCKEKAHSRIESLIRKVSEALDKTEADQNTRNQLLYPLRNGLKRLEKADTTEAVRDILSQLEDLTDDFL
ncbi:MAG: hypothetical protein WC836_02200 [Desulfobacula sp.]|jgi:hypothetical protein